MKTIEPNSHRCQFGRRSCLVRPHESARPPHGRLVALAYKMRAILISLFYGLLMVLGRAETVSFNLSMKDRYTLEDTENGR